MKRFFPLLLLLVIFPHNLHAQKTRLNDLLPVTVNGKWGLIDQTGKVVIEPRFQALGDLFRSVDLLPVLIETKWGYIDQTGSFKIDPAFDEALPFFNGLAAVRVGPKWGFIDPSGTMRIPPQFAEVGWGRGPGGPFSEGLAPVLDNGIWGYINKAGEFVVKPGFTRADSFFHGIARVKTNAKDGAELTGYINKFGVYVSQPLPESYGPEFTVGEFAEGYSLVKNGAQWGFVNELGEIVASGFAEAKVFSEGLAAVKKGDRWGYIDKKMHVSISHRFVEADAFSEGLALVTEADGTHEYIDNSGKVVIRLGSKTNSYASRFKNGLATINRPDGSGYIDRTGKFAIKLNPGDWAGPFDGEFARVGRGELTAYVDKSGRYLFQPQRLFDPKEWSEGLLAARSERNGDFGYIDQTGKFVIAPTFHEAQSFSHGLALVRRVNHYGFIDREGKFVVPLQFDEAWSFIEGIARVKIGRDLYENKRLVGPAKLGYLDTKGNFIWKPSN